MGGNNSSKQTKDEEKTHQSNPEYELPPQEKQRNDQLQGPTNDRPVELSWLQQNNPNDNYNRMDHHHHHHHHHHEPRRRVPIAINRWPKTIEQNPKSYIEEYIHQ